MVVEVYIDRLLELQIDEGLAVYVVPVRPLARVQIREGGEWRHYGHVASIQAAYRSS